MSTLPRYPDFPQTEYNERIIKAREAMKERNLDALFLSEFENVYYMTGFLGASFAGTRDWPYALIVKADGDVCFIERGGTGPIASYTTWLPASSVVDYMRIPEAGEAMRKAFADMGLKGGRVGAELGSVQAVKFSTGIFLDLIKSAGVSFVDGADAIWDVRMVKSKIEVDRIREAAKIASRASERAFGQVKVGMTERDVSRLVSQYMIEEGAERPAWTTIVQSGDKFTDGLGGTFPSMRKIQSGEYVQVDFGATYHHYNSDLNRMALMGRQPTESERYHWSLYVEANKKGAAAVRPGVTAEDIFRAMEKVFEEGGVKYVGVRAGHGLGLDPHEPPHLGIGDKTVVKAGMVFAIEPFAAPNKDGIRFNCEDDVVCNETGYERLSMQPSEILVI
jgi:Xaa-Pro dipeptidase